MFQHKYAPHWFHFNPHLPCGRRPLRDDVTMVDVIFQSTPSLRKATSLATNIWPDFGISIHTFLAEGDSSGGKCRRRNYISIHTFLAEGDSCKKEQFLRGENFNPHLPCGRRQAKEIARCARGAFQSTPSLRKATPALEILKTSLTFQSTPSLRKATANISQITSEFLLASNKTLLF